MKFSSVRCNQCGGPLDIREGTRYLTCGDCGSELEVHRSENSLQTSLLRKLDQRTGQMERKLQVIQLQNELSLKEQKWVEKKETFKMRGAHGKKVLPNKTNMVITGVLLLLGLIGILVVTKAQGPMVLVVALTLVWMIARAVLGFIKADTYELAKQQHQRERSELMVRIERAKKD